MKLYLEIPADNGKAVFYVNAYNEYLKENGNNIVATLFHDLVLAHSGNHSMGFENAKQIAQHIISSSVH